MGLGRVDKLHSLTWACTQPTQSGWCKVRAPLVLEQATGNTDTQDSPRPGLGEATTFPLIVYSAALHRGYIQMTIFPGTPEWESRNRAKWDSRDFGGP